MPIDPDITRAPGERRHILILGAAVWPDGPSPTLRRRTLHAAGLWRAGDVLIPCGGLGRHPPTEAAAMRRLLMDAGIPDAAILPEDRSTDTAQNVGNAAALIAPRTGPVVIVTDAWHAPRARLLARRAGLHVTSDSPDWRGGHWRAQARYALREALAYIACLVVQRR